tara:strand:+ start:267 stop:512 length:246 start_codon:yes stop_codon:yes gene_type:complete
MSGWWNEVKKPKKPTVSIGVSGGVHTPSREMEEDIDAVVEQNMKEQENKDKFLDRLRTRADTPRPQKRELPEEYYQEGVAS